MSNGFKNLREITWGFYDRRIYTMGVGVTWDDLTETEKRQLYESESYLHEYYREQYRRIVLCPVWLVYYESTKNIVGYMRDDEESVASMCDKIGAKYIYLTDIYELAEDMLEFE